MAEAEAQVDPWPIVYQFLHHEGEEQDTTPQKKRIDETGIEPVETVPLVERGIKQAESRA